MNSNGRPRPSRQPGPRAVQAVTTDGRVITMSERAVTGRAHRTAAERLLLDTNLSSSAPAALAFRGLLLVAVVVAAIIVWI